MQKSKNLKPPLSSQELRQLYRQNPTPELARALWEIARLKFRMEQFTDDYIKVMAMWPRVVEERPVMLEMLKASMLVETREAWPRPREKEKPLDFTKGTIFEDLDDEHPEDRALMAEWIRRHGKPP
ncbi:hypothetical protein [Herbaspirillum sp. CAH-3]|uniref:hypothetical protein n=1 Tax=Herbaspirillum sp. CAH-3 TaxID=2605746 RepID=UPI0012ACA260|nr:hypothetical protein [Herbaspirillum sp. CAH-3]MRT30913.1 hypothetical protein [Herbaspirillum sp. CAH-3]